MTFCYLIHFCLLLTNIWSLFIFSQFDWICCDGTEGVCMYVCVWQRYSPNGWMDFDEIFHKWSDRYLWGPFFSDFEISKRWRHGGHFCTFSLGHSHSRNFAPIFFKIGGEVESCLPLFAIENQRDRLVTSANMADRVWEKKIKMAAKTKIFETRQVRCLIRLKLTCWSRIW